MSDYRAPLRDMPFVLNELVGLDAVSGLPGCTEVTAELVGQVLAPGGAISTLAGTATAINIRASGREVS